MNMQLKVFLDTTALLKGFAAFRNRQPLPLYICDSTVKRFTFEKCVFETFMAFRGVGGKKPDEGRGRWAESNLKAEADPASIGKLASRFHDGDTSRAFYWLNQILEAGSGIGNYEQNVRTFVKPEELHRALEEVQALRQLVDERNKFDALCQEFYKFLDLQAIAELCYCEVFDFQQGASRQVSPACLDGFVRDTALPSEDFEIVYAAMTMPADVFVTDDERLITCTMSLGLNYPISRWRFCKGIEYENKVKEIRESYGA
jgi:hypothetical protein